MSLGSHWSLYSRTASYYRLSSQPVNVLVTFLNRLVSCSTGSLCAGFAYCKVLLRLDYRIHKDRVQKFPLSQYATEWSVSRGLRYLEFENMPSVRQGRNATVHPFNDDKTTL
jgi:hypothetical protein